MVSAPRPPTDASGRRLTRANTTKGTPQRRSVYAYEHARRTAPERLSRLGVTRGQAVGHAPAGRPAVSELKRQRAWTSSFYGRDAEGNPVVVQARTTYVESQRAGRYLANVSRLADGKITPVQFRARTRRVTIAGRPVVSDPRGALAVDAAERQRNAEGRPELFFDSGRVAVNRARKAITDRRRRGKAA